MTELNSKNQNIEKKFIGSATGGNPMKEIQS